MQSSATLPSMMRQKSYYPEISGSFFQEGRQNWIQQRTRILPSTSGVSETAFFSPSPIADLQLYHLPPPLLSPISNSSCLFTWYQPCCTVLRYFSTYCSMIKNVFLKKKFSLFFVCFLYITYVKSIINLLQYSITVQYSN